MLTRISAEPGFWAHNAAGKRERLMEAIRQFAFDAAPLPDARPLMAPGGFAGAKCLDCHLADVFAPLFPARSHPAAASVEPT